tara:strand:+ start:113 stop:304 length:192 start_codon:yes stop_codon:yes gene_type:complete
MHQVAARVSAARTALELALYLGPNSVKGSEEGSLCEITPVQLSSLFERWEDEQMSITEYVIPL